MAGEKSHRFGLVGSLVPLISLLSPSDKLSSHWMNLQRRYDLSGLECLSSPDSAQRDEEWEHLFTCLVDLQIGDINLFIFRVCQLHRTAAPTEKQKTGKQIPLKEGKHMTSEERLALLCSTNSQGV